MPKRFLAWARRWKRFWKVAVAICLIAAGYRYLRAEPAEVQSGTTFDVRRGTLDITVLEGGSVDALESQEIKSEVQGQTKILSIIEEGYTVTDEDVKQGKILVELDSKELVDLQTTQELQYLNTLANYTEAKEGFDIQINQNRSDIATAQLAAKFARVDFEKYLGADVAREILAQLGVDQVNFDDPGVSVPEEVPLETPDGLAGETPTEGSGEDAVRIAEEEAEKEAEKEKLLDSPIDFAQYASAERLGDGEARQLLRKLEDGLVLAKKELGLSQTQFEGTQRLAKKDFITTTELENERLKVERNQISQETAETERDLFIKYTFPKMAEKNLAEYIEALRKLNRAEKLALSKLAQAEAKLKSAQASYELQSNKRKDIQEQISKCKIKAERPGLVVYNNNDDWHGAEQIEEGASVRERQKIITIPDMNQMAVKVKVHEASIKSIQKGQKARVRIDAYPDEELTGEVHKVAILPDSQNRWMNPDMKVYETLITIEGVHLWMKPGMSAQAEILVKRLPDVLYVPIQAVVPSDGGKVCYVAGLGGPSRCAVEVGEFNNEFIEIKTGLKEGENVLLRAPIVPEEADKKNGDAKNGDAKNGERKDGEKKAPRVKRDGASEGKPGKAP